MTYRFFSHYYLSDYSSSVLASTEVTHCTIVSVSATDEAQASEFFSSFSATAVLASPTHEPAPGPTQAPAGAVDTMAPVVPPSSVAPVPIPAATSPYDYKPDYKPENGSFGTATTAPAPVVTAGAARLGRIGALAAGMAVFLMAVARIAA
jgi:hypothetical protein